MPNQTRQPEEQPQQGRWMLPFRWRPSLAGVYLGTVWLALTFTPSLVPRPWLLQGILGGLAFALGYGAGAGLLRLWNYLELPLISLRLRRPLYAMLFTVSVLQLGWYLWHSSGWQNDTLRLAGLPPLGETHYVKVIALAAGLAAVLIGLAEALRAGITATSRLSLRIVHRRFASVAGTAAFLTLLVVTVNGTLVSAAISIIDKMQAATDVEDPPGAVPPDLAARSGSPHSLIRWDELGHAGKRFVHEGPRRADIEAFRSRPAVEPIRIYVGLRSADDPAAQAKLALEELKRTDAFSREVLVIATPTGTGWVDNAGIAPLEYMHDGNTAVVGVQYSYLQSPLSLILEPGRSQASAAAVFDVIYGHWRHLPKDKRPRLYLFGLSLGSHGSETSAPLYAYVSEPFQGAVWAGPPFRNALWRGVQRNRTKNSPSWQPAFEDGSMIRVAGNSKTERLPGGNWGPVRIVYVVNPSDAIVFFDETMWRREPEWMKNPRGEGVSSLFQWVPVISFFQVAVDMMSAANVAPGHGHNYAARQYAIAWAAVSAPKSWTEGETERMQVLLHPAK